MTNCQRRREAALGGLVWQILFFGWVGLGWVGFASHYGMLRPTFLAGLMTALPLHKSFRERERERDLLQ